MVTTSKKQTMNKQDDDQAPPDPREKPGEYTMMNTW